MAEASASGRPRLFTFAKVASPDLPRRMTGAALGAAHPTLARTLTPRHRVPESKPMTMQAQWDALLNIGDNWNDEGAPAPSKDAIAMAVGAMKSAIESGIVPSAIRPSADGGAGFHVSRKAEGVHRVAYVCCTNAGRTTVSLIDRIARESRGAFVYQDAPRDLFKLIGNFLQTGEYRGAQAG